MYNVICTPGIELTLAMNIRNWLMENRIISIFKTRMHDYQMFKGGNNVEIIRQVLEEIFSADLNMVDVTGNG